jgi:SAM-dependent methyltransferase
LTNDRPATQDVLRQGLLKRVREGSAGTGALVLPGVPTLLDFHVETVDAHLGPLGRVLSEAERKRLRDLLVPALDEARRLSSYSDVRTEWRKDNDTPQTLEFSVSVVPDTLSDMYREWTTLREPPYFGSSPAAKVMDVARSLGAPEAVPCLDIGAGTGRNALPLARLGHRVDAVELSPVWLVQLRQAVEAERLPVTVIEADILAADVSLPSSAYRFVFLNEVFFHFRVRDEIRLVLARAADWLSPGGVVLFDIFLADEGFEPDLLTRQAGEALWTGFLTRPELMEVIDGLPLELVSDESVHEYERAAMPADAWPPVFWFEEWVRGQDLFDVPAEQSPVEMRWIVLERA